MLQCLERTFNGKAYEVPIPVQTDFSTYGMECDVDLDAVPHSSPCKKDSLVMDHGLRIEHDKTDNSYAVTLVDPNGTRVFSGEAIVHGAPDDVRYLEYQRREGPEAHPTKSVDYFFYLVDPDPKSLEQRKYYLAEAFDNFDNSQLCALDRPSEKLKVKAKCDESMQFLSVTPSGEDQPPDVSDKQTDTGGGYEPPK